MLRKLLSKLTGCSTDDEADNQVTVSDDDAETGVRHVMSSEDGWVILKDPESTSSMTFDTKKAAVNEARTVCKEKGLRLAIYKQDGSKQREHDYAD